MKNFTFPAQFSLFSTEHKKFQNSDGGNRSTHSTHPYAFRKRKSVRHSRPEEHTTTDNEKETRLFEKSLKNLKKAQQNHKRLLVEFCCTRPNSALLT